MVRDWGLAAVGSRQLAVGRKRGVTTWSKRGNKDRHKIEQNLYKIPHFKVFPRREAKISLFKNISAPKLAAPPLAGFKTGAETGRYGGGIIKGWEYKETERTCRSPGAPGAPRVVVSRQ